MAQYGIMRIEKRGRHAVGGLQREAVREESDRGKVTFDNSDIDWDRTKNNIRLRDCRHWNAEVTRQIRAAGVKERKDSIVMLDGLYTASPEWFETHSRAEWLSYFKDCLAYHDRTYGRAFSAVIHLDEETPHMTVQSVPLIEDEKGVHLSAKIIMGGRSEYRHRQEEFYQTVTKSRGLDRGEIREAAEVKRHVKVQDYKRAQNAAKIAEQEHAIERNDALIERQGGQYAAAKKTIERAQDVEPLVRALDAAQNSSQIAQNARKSLFSKKLKISPSDLKTLALRASMGEEMQRALMKAAGHEDAARKESRKAAADRKAAEGERAAAERVRDGGQYREQVKKLDDVINRYNEVVQEYNELVKEQDSLQQDVYSLEREKAELSQDVECIRNERYMRRFCRQHQQEFDSFARREQSRERDMER